MSKPLELVVYPTAASRGYVAEGPGVFIKRDEHGRRIGSIPVGHHYKRLTDAELAAESFRLIAWLGALWRTVAGYDRHILIAPAYTFGPITRDEHEWQTIHRFALHPHYDEVTP